MATEQPPVTKRKHQPEMATVTIKKSGDEGIDVGLVDHYVSLGYQFKEKSPTGSIEMEMPRDRVMALHQATIDEHYRRVKGAQKASLGADVNLVEDRSEVLSPKSDQEMIDSMDLDNE
jgi:hypothetical protein